MIPNAGYGSILDGKDVYLRCVKGKRGNPTVPLFDYMDIRDQIHELVNTCLDSEAFADCFMIDLHCTAQGAVTLFVDADAGMTLSRCRDLSRMLEQRIDALGLFGGKYVLEVSSPGADRPLVMKRQYPKHVGRTLQVLMTDGTKLEGTLSGMKEDTLELTIKNGKQPALKEISFERIKESFVQISFKKRK